MKIPNKPFIRAWNYCVDCFNHGNFWAKRWGSGKIGDLPYPKILAISKPWLDVKSYPEIPRKEKDPNWRTRDNNWVVFQVDNTHVGICFILFRETAFSMEYMVGKAVLNTPLFAMRVSELPFQISTRKFGDYGSLKPDSKLLKPTCVYGAEKPLSTKQVRDYVRRVGVEVTFI